MGSKSRSTKTWSQNKGGGGTVHVSERNVREGGQARKAEEAPRGTVRFPVGKGISRNMHSGLLFRRFE